MFFTMCKYCLNINRNNIIASAILIHFTYIHMCRVQRVFVTIITRIKPFAEWQLVNSKQTFELFYYYHFIEKWKLRIRILDIAKVANRKAELVWNQFVCRFTRAQPAHRLQLKWNKNHFYLTNFHEYYHNYNCNEQFEKAKIKTPTEFFAHDSAVFFSLHLQIYGTMKIMWELKKK